MTSLREDTTMIFEKSSYAPSTPRWRDKRITQESRSGESFKRVVRDDHLRL